MKHIGKMKNNSAKVAVVFRTLPGDPHHALVVGTQGLADSHHDSLMSLIESDAGQNANELADILSARLFPDGTNMLGYLHSREHLKKVPTNMVLMTPNSKTALPLDSLNQMIADNQGITLEQLADPTGQMKANTKTQETHTAKKEEIVIDSAAVDNTPVTASDLRSMAAKLFKEAQALRKKADEMEPPKKKEKATKVE